MLKRIIWSIFLRPTYSLPFILVFFVLGSLMLLGLAWNSSTNEEIDLARNKWGLKAIVQVNARKLFEAEATKPEVIQVPSSHLGESKEAERFLPSQKVTLTLSRADAISKLPEVKSAQYISVTNVVGKNLQPVVPTDSTKESLEVTDGLSVPQFQLIGVLKSEVLDEFKSLDSILVSGSDISPADFNTNNAIIEHRLAEKNHLKIGDTFELAGLDGKRTEKFVVSGTFVTNKTQNTGLSGKLSFLSNKNQIFVSISAASAFKGGSVENPVIDKAIYTLKYPELEFYEDFRIKSMEKGINSFYDIYSDDSQFKAVSDPLKKGISIGTRLTFTIFICIFIFTFLMLTFTRKKRSEEIQTLLLFGESGRMVFSQILIETLLLIFIGFILAIVVSPVSLEKINHFIKEVTSFVLENNANGVVRSGKYFIDINIANKESAFLNLNLNLKFIDQIGLIMIGLFLSINASILSLIRVLRMSKMNLLIDRDLEETV